MKITTEMIQEAYSASADVYDGKISRQQAINDLETKFGMNSGSASDGIVNFKKMMDGKKYTRTNAVLILKRYMEILGSVSFMCITLLNFQILDRAIKLILLKICALRALIVMLCCTRKIRLIQ